MSEEARDLLAAVLEALDIPDAVPGALVQRLELLESRCINIRVAVGNVVQQPDIPLPPVTAQLRRWTAESPATYRTTNNEEGDNA